MNFRDLVSGRRRGLAAGLARTGLGLLEFPYAIAIHWRNRRFDRPASFERVHVPVISVGNLTVGGTGKTPMVQWLATWFRRQGVRVALVSRGYGAEEGSRNDEALQLEQALPDVPHVQDANRVAASQMAIEEFQSQLIVLDDGFQHRRLHRDLDIVLLDALDPFGHSHLLPRGLLREPVASLRRAHIVALSRVDMISAEERARIRDVAVRYAPDAAWVETVHRPRRLLAADGSSRELDAFNGQTVAAFCGIGNPLAFEHTLRSCGYLIADVRHFPDHHAYDRQDVEGLADWAQSLSGVKGLVCTHKDLVKLGTATIGGVPLWALAIELEIVRGQDELEARLRTLLARIPSADA